MPVNVTIPEIIFLSQRGWPLEAGVSFDMCWLDCSQQGWLHIWGEPGKDPLCICLCPAHALYLERGRWGSDYSGAPLPPESKATEWPWRPCSEVTGVAAA
jgi:hypothetical protein